MNRRKLLQTLGVTAIVGASGAIASFIAYPYFVTKAHKELMISGSKSVSRFVALLLAPFMEKFSHARISLEGGGSFAGLVALANGGIDLAMMSRDLSFEEFNLDLHSHLIGIEGIAIVVHPSLNIKTITLEQLDAILIGSITNWYELGGPNKVINVYGRMEGSTTRAFIEDMVLRGSSFVRSAKLCDSAIQLVNSVAADPVGLGFVTLKNLSDQVKTLAINGVQISDKTLLLKLYPLSRDMFLVNKNSGSHIAKEFIRYSLSSPAQAIFVKQGLTQVSR